MINFLTAIHVLSCLVLIVVILMQSGRGGGLTEGFASAESMFGAKTNEFMVKSTTIMATVFIITSLSLASLAAKQKQSLLTGQTAVQQNIPAEVEIPVETSETNGPVAESQNQ